MTASNRNTKETAPTIRAKKMTMTGKLITANEAASAAAARTVPDAIT